MTTVAHSSGAVLKLSPGSGVQFDPASGGMLVDPEALAAGVAFRLDAQSADGAKRAFQVTVTEIPQRAGTVTSFEAPGELDKVSFLGARPAELDAAERTSPGWCRRQRCARMATGLGRAATASIAA